MKRDLTVQTDFLSFNDKSKIPLLIKELEELKMMTDGTGIFHLLYHLRVTIDEDFLDLTNEI